jgi:hypothetical protein
MNFCQAAEADIKELASFAESLSTDSIKEKDCCAKRN